MARHHVTTNINGDEVEFLCDTDQTVLDVLRDELQLTGTKEGCATGDCGACSVTVDGRLVCACLMLGVEAEGKNIATIEGMAEGEVLHPLQRKFIEHAALQCGICTPGVLVAATAATAWPSYNAFSRAMTLRHMSPKLIIASPAGTNSDGSSGKSSRVTTARTPGRASALETSIDLITACG